MHDDEKERAIVQLTSNDLIAIGLQHAIRDSHEAAVRCGWYTDLTTGEPLQRNLSEMLMLIVSEISEANEGVRKNLMDDKLPHRKMEEVEIVDALIRIFDYAGYRKLDLAGAYLEKRAYNDNRADLARTQAGDGREINV